MFAQPLRASIDTLFYKHAGSADLGQLRREIKKLRYNNYILRGKLEKVTTGCPPVEFKLPSRFILGGEGMGEVITHEKKLVEYLLDY